MCSVKVGAFQVVKKKTTVLRAFSSASGSLGCQSKLKYSYGCRRGPCLDEGDMKRPEGCLGMTDGRGVEVEGLGLDCPVTRGPDWQIQDDAP